MLAETIRTDAVTLALEYLSVRDATEHEFRDEEERAAYAEVLKALGRFQHATSFSRALAELDISPEAADPGPQHHLMRSIAWSFGDGATFPGYTDDTHWNGFTNVWVSPSVCPGMPTRGRPRTLRDDARRGPVGLAVRSRSSIHARRTRRVASRGA